MASNSPELARVSSSVGAPHWVPLASIAVGGQLTTTASRADLTAAMAADCLRARSDGFSFRPRLVFDVNGHGLSLRQTSDEYRSVIDLADVVHADGGFLVSYSRWFRRTPIAERSATTDLIHDFARRAAEDGLGFYLLGGEESVNAACAVSLEQHYPGLRVVGRRNGFFAEDELDEVITQINAAKPEVVWVGLGKPKEQLFAARNAHRIRAGWIVTCGGCFNYITGAYPRAPMWMQNANLEWLHRMATNPRLLWRYLTTTPHALWLLAAHHRSTP